MSKNTRTGLIIAGIGLAVVSVFCVLTVIGIVNMITNESSQVQFFTSDSVKATAYETLTFDASGLTALDLDLDFSDVEITGSEDGQITLELIKTGWGSDEAQAQAAADALALEEEQRGGTLTLSSPRREAEINVFTIESRPDTIDLNIAVPEDMEINLDIGTGQVSVTGYEGELAIKTGYGNTTVEDFAGSLSVSRNNGKLTLNAVTLTSPLSLGTDFGDIFITDLDAPEIRIDNQNGRLTLQNLAISGGCQLDADFTTIEIDTIECDALTIESKNGPIELNHGQISGPLTITTDFGDLSIKDLPAESFALTSRNGKIYANTLQGEAHVDGDFGDIELYSQEEVSLNVENRNGNITFQGVLAPEVEHTIRSDFGEIEIRIPPESAFDVYLATEFGEIETDFPITLSGKLSASEIEGSINGGGPLLTLESKNGHIILNYLEN